MKNNPIYQEAKKLIKEGVSFKLVNQYGEKKVFRAGSSIYDVETVKCYIKLAEFVEEILTVEII